jgi:hypothetical protein
MNLPDHKQRLAVVEILIPQRLSGLISHIVGIGSAINLICPLPDY